MGISKYSNTLPLSECKRYNEKLGYTAAPVICWYTAYRACLPIETYTFHEWDSFLSSAYSAYVNKAQMKCMRGVHYVLRTRNFGPKSQGTGVPLCYVHSYFGRLLQFIAIPTRCKVKDKYNLERKSMWEHYYNNDRDPCKEMNDITKSWVESGPRDWSFEFCA